MRIQGFTILKKLKTVFALTSLTIFMACEGSNDQATTLMQSSRGTDSSFCTITAQENALDFGSSIPNDSNVYLYSTNQLNEGLQNFYNYFQYDSLGTIINLDSSYARLKTSSIQSLYSIISEDSTLNFNPSTDYGAMRFHFGMQEKKLIIIFEPLILRSSETPNECNVISTQMYYVSNSLGEIDLIDNEAFATLVQNFQGENSKININHPSNVANKKFIATDDTLGDIKSCTMSFQEIVRMYCDNSASPNNDDLINFWIIAKNCYLNNPNYQLGIVASFRIGESAPMQGSFKNYAADYSQMCPPKCNIVEINYYSN